jgi:hypothetical protein
MNTLKILLIGILLVWGHISVFAQDKMYLRNERTPLVVKVVEIGLDEVKFKYWPVKEDDIIHAMSKDKILRIVTQSGDVFEFKSKIEELNDPKTFADAPKNIIKFRLLSPLSGAASFYYERSIKPTSSIEAGIAFVGIGTDVNSNRQRGVVLRTGYKMMRPPQYYTRSMSTPSLMNGPYFKPELLFTQYSVDRMVSVTTNSGGFGTTTIQTVRRTVNAGAAFANFGYQWVVGNFLVIDYSIGVGYGFSNYAPIPNRIFFNDDAPEIFHYGFVGGTSGFPIALTAAFKLGYMF